MYRRDRRKGGGGLIAYFSTTIPFKILKLPNAYTTIEAIAVESSIGRREILFIAVYTGHLNSLERALNQYVVSLRFI